MAGRGALERVVRLATRAQRMGSPLARTAVPCVSSIARTDLPAASSRSNSNATATMPWVTQGFAADARTRLLNHKHTFTRYFATNNEKEGSESEDDEDDGDDDEPEFDDGDAENLAVGVLPKRDTLPETQGTFLDALNIPVYSIDGSKTGETVTLPGRIFDVPLRVDVVQRVVVWQRNRKRRGLHKTKTRAQVKGTTKKARPQKGGGRARVGDLRAPQMRGGGVAHGPVVRSHATKLQRKVRKLGLKIALSAKAAEGRVVIVDNLHDGVVDAKTKWLDSALDTLLGAGALAAGERQHSVLMAEIPPSEDTPGALAGKKRDPRSSDMVPVFESRGKRASKNLPHVHVMHQKGLNVYDILKHRSLAITKEALEDLIKRIDAPVKR
tara:strand:- start:28115 stop:29263 length:1149 start_codon:yes stop_codon:yes gene_type:complete